MMKPARRTKTKPMPTADSDSDSSEDDSPTDDEFMSDEEFPMSGDDSAEENGSRKNGETEESVEPTKWAKVMAKILRKPAGKILSKAFTDADIERKKKETQVHKFEVVNAEGAVKEETTDSKKGEDKPDDLKLATELLRQKALLKKERRKDILGLRVRPSIHDHERERTMRKVATKGAVQMFNAVRKQQKEVNRMLDDAGRLESKREKVLKNLSKKEFLDALMNGPRAKSELVDNLVKKEEDETEVKSEVESDEEPKSTWGALRADFLTGKKSGWDKEDGEQESKEPDDLDDEMGSDSD